jgi:hypothetical protein
MENADWHNPVKQAANTASNHGLGAKSGFATSSPMEEVRRVSFSRIPLVH